ncbi:AH receptor-interacting protein-like [Brevipalpus obovatus]|uniref:AH receptor-interacting protein-like n=1 Tax=Brevipalpus obovatus TaxID=246614 RepID=UPI003D9F7007
MNGTQKKIIHPGKGDIPNFTPDSKVIFHFKTSQMVDGSEKIIDDSRSKGKPMEMIIGKKFKLEQWEECIKTMRIGEVAKITCSKTLVPSYVFVAKQYRKFAKRTDSGADSNSDEQSHTSSCCGMALKGSTGYPDLDSLLRGPSELEFHLELLEVYEKDRYEQELWQMTEKDQIEALPDLRKIGNDSFKSGEYEKAAKSYSKALDILENLMLREKPNSEEWFELDLKRVVFFSNLAQCKIKTHDYYEAIENCNQVLKREPNNVKALFRKAVALMHASDFKESRQAFEQVKRLDSDIVSVVNRHLKELDIKEKKSLEQEKSMFAGKLFS